MRAALPPSRSNRLVKKVWCCDGKLLISLGTCQHLLPTPIHNRPSPMRPRLWVLFKLGNLAIHKWPCSSVTQALGLAPPNDEPGEISIFNQRILVTVDVIVFFILLPRAQALERSHWRRSKTKVVVLKSIQLQPLKSNSPHPIESHVRPAGNPIRLIDLLLECLCAFQSPHAAALKIHPHLSGDESRNARKFLSASSL